MESRKFSHDGVWTTCSTTVNHVFTRAVILPATPLLVPGAAGAADPLREVRLAACAALGVLAEAGPPLVLAHGPVSGPGSTAALGRPGTRGPRVLLPSLAAAGIADGMLPDDVLAPWASEQARPPAGTAASVLLFCLGMALGERAAGIPVLEIDPSDDAGEPGPGGIPRAGAAPAAAAAGPVSVTRPGNVTGRAAVVGMVRAHLEAGGTLVVGSGGRPGPAAVAPHAPGALAPAIEAVLAAVGAHAAHAEHRTFSQSHDHLPAEYVVTTLGAVPARGVA